MTNRKTNGAEADDLKPAEKKFTKEQILASEKYANRKDLVNALLVAGRQYTKSEVDELIDKFMKGKVK